MTTEAGSTIAFDDQELLSTAKGELFSFNGYSTSAKIVDIYDGDTVTAAFRFGGKIIQYKVRMDGYDSPEMKPKKTNPKREEEKAAALMAKNALSTKIGGGLVLLKFKEFDKYGRLLADAYTPNGEHINAWMIAEGHGYVYEGGTKKAFDS